MGMETTKSAKSCLICTASIRFSRLGVHACRACAAFYKRSTINGKQFVCRQGGGRCTFRKHEKFMCRSCRYDKCIELGMEYYPVEKETEDDDDVDANMPSSTTNTQNNNSRNADECVLLEAMRIAYEHSYEKRIDYEMKVVKHHRLKRLDHPTEDFYISNLISYNDILPNTIRQIVDIFEPVFPFLNELIIEDKAALFQDFIGKFCILEGFYRSYTFTDSNRFLLTLITSVNTENFDSWIREEDCLDRKSDVRSITRNYGADQRCIMLPLFAIEQFTQQEFMALLIIGFCDVDLSLELPEFIFEKLASIRQQVFTELQDYYKNEENLSDISSRMGTLMTVSHSTSEAGLSVNEELHTYSALFDLCSSDSLLREIFFQ